MRREMKLLGVVMVCAALVLGVGCFGGRSLLKETQTKEEKAAALVLEFDSYQQGILELVQNTAVPLKEKQILRDANRVASPAARMLKQVRADYVDVKGDVDAIWKAGNSPDQALLETLALAGDRLDHSLNTDGPVIEKFKRTMTSHNVQPLLIPSEPAAAGVTP